MNKKFLEKYRPLWVCVGWGVLNVGIYSLAATLRTVVVDSWKKGPLIDPAAPYAPENAQLYLTWILLWLLNSYLLGLLGVFKLSRPNSVVRMLGPLMLFCLSLIGAEIGMQSHLARHQTTHFRPHPTLHWMCRPNLQSFVSSSDGIVLNTNQHGMREAPTAYSKEAGEYRIIVLGDSSNFGQGVSGTEMWSHQLQEILASTSVQKVSVLNAACPGWTTHQGVEVMAAYGWNYEPDLVIAGFNNDAGPDFMTDRERVSNSATVRYIQSVLYRSEVFVIAREALLSWIRKLSPTAQQAYKTRLAGERAKYGKLKDEERLPLVSRVPLSEMEENLLSLKNEATTRGAHFMWINMPINRKEFELVDRYVDWEYRQRMVEFTDSHQIPYVGVDEYWQRTREPDLHILGHVFHPNAEGHRRMGEQIASEIAQYGWIDGVQPNKIAGPPPASNTDVLRFGWSSKTPIHAHIGVALQLYPKLVEQAGLEIEWVAYDSGKEQGDDLAKGKLDAWFSCAVPAIHMLNSRPDAKVVSTLGSLGEIALIKRKRKHPKSDLRRVGLTKGSTPHQVWNERKMSPSIVVENLRGDELWQALETETVDGIVTWDPWVTEWTQPGEGEVEWSQPFYSVLIVGEMWAFGNIEDPRVPKLIELLKTLIVEIQRNPDPIDQRVAELGGWSLETVRQIREQNAVFSSTQSMELSQPVIQELKRSHRFVNPRTGGFYSMAPEWRVGLPRRP